MEYSLLLGMYLLLSLFSVTQTQCPATCSCSDGVIDCSSRAFNSIPDITVPTGFAVIKEVDLSDNMIRVLDIDQLTKTTKGLTVNKYDFSSNVIDSVVGIFDSNAGTDYDIMILSNNAFSTFPRNIVPKKHIRAKLVIDMSYNQLTELTYQMFAGGDDTFLPGFQFLARNNMISAIHPETFQGLELTDTILDLRFNRLASLPDTYKHPRGVKQINMSGNPWECDCNLRWIVDEDTKFGNYTQNDPPNCQTPSSLTGRPIFQLTPNEFTCLPEQDGTLRYSFQNTDTYTLQCPVAADPPNPDISWNVWLPCPDEREPLQLFFSSETITFKDIVKNPKAAVRCTATNNAGSLSLNLDVTYNGEQGLPIPDGMSTSVTHSPMNTGKNPVSSDGSTITMVDSAISTVGGPVGTMVPVDRSGSLVAIIIVLIILLIISLIAVAIMLYSMLGMKKQLKAKPVKKREETNQQYHEINLPPSVTYSVVNKDNNGANGSAMLSTATGEYEMPDKSKKAMSPPPSKPAPSPYIYNTERTYDKPPMRFDYYGNAGYGADHNGSSNI